MTRATNPYAPPRSVEPKADAGAESEGVVAVEPESAIPPGHYELEAADVAAGVRATVGRRVRAYSVILLVVATTNLVFASVRGARAVVPIATVAWMGIAAFLFLVPWVHGRRISSWSVERRRRRVKLDARGLTVETESGELVSRTAWGALRGRIETKTHVFLSEPLFVHILPRRAWTSDEEFAAVRTLIAARVPPARTPFRSWLWVIVVTVVTIFSLLGHPPASQPSPVTPASQ